MCKVEMQYKAVEVIRDWLADNVQHVEWEVEFAPLYTVQIILRQWVGGHLYYSSNPISPQIVLDSEDGEKYLRAMVEKMAEGLGRAMFIVGEAKEKAPPRIIDSHGRDIS